MSAEPIAIDALLVAALRGDQDCDSVSAVFEFDAERVIDRIAYHGVAGLLWGDQARIARWPGPIRAFIAQEARALTMWELRHRHMVDEVLTALAAAGVVAILLKGTALAYDLYPTPATRARGDSDLLVAPGDRHAARLVLTRLGFLSSGGGNAEAPFALQEVWRRICDGDMTHHLDLHWQTLNCPALARVLDGAACAAHRIALPRLGPDAQAMDRVRTLIHTCLHRMLNFASPYFIGDRTYYGGDRLIWLHDIDLLSRALTPAEWADFTRLAISEGVPAACLDGLRSAQRQLATPLPLAVEVALQPSSSMARPDAYLRARQLGRAWRDLGAIRGWRNKAGYFLTRGIPAATFVRDKYPRHVGSALPLLYARRLIGLFRPRPLQDAER